MDALRDLAGDESLLWYLMRGGGVVLLVLLTVSVVLGTAASTAAPVAQPGRTPGRVPRFVVQTVHRDLSVISLVLLAVHVVSAVLHSYVDIRWVDVVVPFIGPYEPLWIGLGAVGLDLLVVASLAAAFRGRLGTRSWRAVHLMTYVAWAVSLAHAVGIGTERTAPWAVWLAGGCLLAFVVACLVRLVSLRRRGDRAESDRAGSGRAGSGRADSGRVDDTRADDAHATGNRAVRDRQALR